MEAVIDAFGDGAGAVAEDFAGGRAVGDEAGALGFATFVSMRGEFSIAGGAAATCVAGDGVGIEDVDGVEKITGLAEDSR